MMLVESESQGCQQGLEGQIEVPGRAGKEDRLNGPGRARGARGARGSGSQKLIFEQQSWEPVFLDHAAVRAPGPPRLGALGVPPPWKGHDRRV